MSAGKNKLFWVFWALAHLFAFLSWMAFHGWEDSDRALAQCLASKTGSP